MVCRETRELGDRRRAFHPPPLLSLALRLSRWLCTCLTLTPHTYSPEIKTWRGPKCRRERWISIWREREILGLREGARHEQKTRAVRGQKARGTPLHLCYIWQGREGAATQVGLSLLSLYTDDTLSPSSSLLFGVSSSVGVTALQGCKLCIVGSKGQEHTSLTADVTV